MLTMKQFIIASIAVFTFFIVEAQQLPSSAENKNLSYKIIPSVNKTWGYDIYSDDKLFIHQLSIPAISGNAGFKTKADAEKVAKLVIDKIKKGEVPPTVSVDEMKKLKVIK
jgi:hypothetical protein